MIHVDDMHWHLWEAIVLQARDMYYKGFVSKELNAEVTAISCETVATGKFSEDLRTRACLVAQALEPNAEEWQKAVAIEYEGMNREAEMYERDYRLQQSVSKGTGLHRFRA